MELGSKELIRNINNNIVLEAIIKQQPISRASLSKTLGLTKTTISSIVQELISKKLIIEVGSGDSSTGRKPILLQFNNIAGYSLAIDLGTDYISILLTDIIGNKCDYSKSDIPEVDSNNIMSILTNTINRTLKNTHKTFYGLIGITISIHGIVKNNKIVFTPYYELEGFPLAEQLERYYNVPIFLKNEANLSVLGEKIYSFDYQNMASLSIHSGVGLGLIINDKLYEGHDGLAGEFGHTIIEIDGKPCPCGNKGCLEQYVSERSLLNKLATLKRLPKISFNEFCDLYSNNDCDAIEIANDFARYMSLSLNNLLNIFNPEIVVLNSHFTNRFPELLDKIIESLNTKNNPNIIASSLKDFSILYGATYINIINFLGIKKFRPDISL